MNKLLLSLLVLVFSGCGEAPKVDREMLSDLGITAPPCADIAIYENGRIGFFFIKRPLAAIEIGNVVEQQLADNGMAAGVAYPIHHTKDCRANQI